ncbi:MAG TPA: hypothetical protein VGM35_01935 [Xanthobacteraceae bacterium]|jgi:hypothetical protein
MVRLRRPAAIRAEPGVSGRARSRYAESIAFVWVMFSSDVFCEDELSRGFADRNVRLRAQSSPRATAFAAQHENKRAISIICGKMRRRRRDRPGRTVKFFGVCSQRLQTGKWPLQARPMQSRRQTA